MAVGTRVTKWTITPQKAQQLLDNNYAKQRPIGSRVNTYAADMRGGRWNSDICAPLIISDKGELLDGQHRCMAVIKAGVPVEMWVQLGVPEDAFKYIDNGKSRTAANVLHVKNSTAVAALGRIVTAYLEGASTMAVYTRGLSARKEHVSRTAIIETIPNYNVEYCADIGRHLHLVMGCGQTSAYSFFAWTLWWLGRDENLVAFLENFKSLQPCTSVAVAKKKISDTYIARKKFSFEELYGLMLWAYEAYEAGGKRKTMRPIDTAIKYEELLDEKRRTMNESEER